MATLTVGYVAPTNIEQNKNPQTIQTKLFPAYISFTGTVAVVNASDSADSLEEKIHALGVTGLNKKIWASLDTESKEKIISTHKFIYLKTDPTGKIIYELGIHISMCAEIKEMGLDRILAGRILLPKDTFVNAIPESSYQKMLKQFLPQLT